MSGMQAGPSCQERLEAALTHIASHRGCDRRQSGMLIDCLRRHPEAPDRWCPSCVATVVLLGGDDD